MERIDGSVHAVHQIGVALLSRNVLAERWPTPNVRILRACAAVQLVRQIQFQQVESGKLRTSGTIMTAVRARARGLFRLLARNVPLSHTLGIGTVGQPPTLTARIQRLP